MLAPKQCKSISKSSQGGKKSNADSDSLNEKYSDDSKIKNKLEEPNMKVSSYKDRDSIMIMVEQEQSTEYMQSQKHLHEH